MSGTDTIKGGGSFFPGQVPIDAYGNGGFRFADMSHRGSLLCLPGGMRGWDVTCAAAIDMASFTVVAEEADRIEVLLIGTGAGQVFLSPDLRDGLAGIGLFAESMATGAAARTYNVLLAEGRAVAAALIATD